MKSVLVIGIGNPLRGDDGIGWHVANCLDTLIFPYHSVQVIATHQLTPELAFTMAYSGLVVFVDAAVDGETGAIRMQEVQPTPGMATFSHTLTPQALMAATHDWYGSDPRGVLFTVSSQHFDHSDKLSEAAQAALPTVIANICALINHESGLQ